MVSGNNSAMLVNRMATIVVSDGGIVMVVVVMAIVLLILLLLSLSVEELELKLKLELGLGFWKVGLFNIERTVCHLCPLYVEDTGFVFGAIKITQQAPSKYINTSHK